MSLPHNKSVTLLELLIAISLLGILVLAFTSIDLFSRYHVLTADRRAQVQNEASYALEHMSKNIVRAIGNEMVYGNNTVVDIIESTGGGERERIKIYIDANGNGLRETVAGTDYWIAYRYNDNSYPTQTKRNQIEFCSRCSNKSCNSCTTGWERVSIKANQVSGLVPYKPGDNTLTDNYLGVEISTCWDPDGVPYVCGSPDNPTVNMRVRIKMPSVSTN